MAEARRKRKRELRDFTQEELVTAVAAARTAYHADHGQKIPEIDDIMIYCRLSKVRLSQIVADDRFVTLMQKQGINWKMKPGLSARQNLALMLATNANDRRPLETKMKQCGVTLGEWRNWLQQPLFKSLVNDFAEQALPDHMAQAHNSLLNQVDKGNMAAIQYYYAMTGRYDPTSRVERDINSILVQVIDIIQRAGLEQDKLELIAGELRDLMSAPQPKELEGTFRSEREDLGFGFGISDVVEVEEVSLKLPESKGFSFGNQHSEGGPS